MIKLWNYKITIKPVEGGISYEIPLNKNKKVIVTANEATTDEEAYFMILRALLDEYGIIK